MPRFPSRYGDAPTLQDSTDALDILPWIAKTVMLISAHPDDIEAMAGGLVAKLTAQGTRVVYVIVTNGDKGCQSSALYNCSTFTAVDIAKIRQKEAHDAAAVLGVRDVELLTFEDGMVTRSVLEDDFLDEQRDMLSAAFSCSCFLFL